MEARHVLAVFGHPCGHFLTIQARYFQAVIFDDPFCDIEFCCNLDEQKNLAESAIRNQPINIGSDLEKSALGGKRQRIIPQQRKMLAVRLGRGGNTENDILRQLAELRQGIGVFVAIYKV